MGRTPKGKPHLAKIGEFTRRRGRFEGGGSGGDLVQNPMVEGCPLTPGAERRQEGERSKGTVETSRWRLWSVHWVR